MKALQEALKNPAAASSVLVEATDEGITLAVEVPDEEEAQV